MRRNKTIQITLIQTEIEQAIKAYVLGQLAIREGQEIEVDLRATRGESGATAVINITQAQATPVQAPVVVAQAPAPVQAPKRVTTADLKRMQEEEAAQEAEAAAKAEAAAVIGTNEDPAPVPAPAPVSEAKPEPEPETRAAPVAANEEAPTAPRKLFAGFTKPVNNAA